MESTFFTDDPLRDFARQDRAEAEWVKNRPVCGYCHEPIYDDFYYEIGGAKICPVCMETYFRREIEE